MIKNKNTIEAIFNKLNMVERGILFKYINDESHNIMMDIANQMDHCIVAALIESFPNLNMDTIEEIANSIARLREEQEPKLEALKNISDEELDKMNEEMSKRIDDLLVSGVKQAEVIRVLKKEFPKFPQAALVRAYKSAKEKFKPNDVEDISTEELASYIVDGIKKEVTVTKEKSKFKVSFMQIQGETDTYDLDIIKKTINGQSVTGVINTIDTEIDHLTKEIEILNKRRIDLELQVQEIKEIEREFITE